MEDIVLQDFIQKNNLEIEGKIKNQRGRQQAIVKKGKNKFIIKCLTFFSDEEASEYLKILKRIQNSNYKYLAEICHLQHFRDSKKVIYSQKFYENNLQDFLQAKPHQDTAKQIAVSLLRCIIFLHYQGISHLNLKPQNILIDNKLNVKVGDLYYEGKIEDVSDKLYFPHEQQSIQRIISYQSDFYSVGALLCDIFGLNYSQNREQFQNGSFPQINNVQNHEEIDKAFEMMYYCSTTRLRPSGMLKFLKEVKGYKVDNIYEQNIKKPLSIIAILISIILFSLCFFSSQSNPIQSELNHKIGQNMNTGQEELSQNPAQEIKPNKNCIEQQEECQEKPQEQQQFDQQQDLQEFDQQQDQQEFDQQQDQQEQYDQQQEYPEKQHQQQELEDQQSEPQQQKIEQTSQLINLQGLDPQIYSECEGIQQEIDLLILCINNNLKEKLNNILNQFRINEIIEKLQPNQSIEERINNINTEINQIIGKLSSEDISYFQIKQPSINQKSILEQINTNLKLLSDFQSQNQKEFKNQYNDCKSLITYFEIIKCIKQQIINKKNTIENQFQLKLNQKQDVFNLFKNIKNEIQTKLKHHSYILPLIELFSEVSNEESSLTSIDFVEIVLQFITNETLLINNEQDISQHTCEQLSCIDLYIYKMAIIFERYLSIFFEGYTIQKYNDPLQITLSDHKQRELMNSFPYFTNYCQMILSKSDKELLLCLLYNLIQMHSNSSIILNKTFVNPSQIEYTNKFHLDYPFFNGFGMQKYIECLNQNKENVQKELPHTRSYFENCGNSCRDEFKKSQKYFSENITILQIKLMKYELKLYQECMQKNNMPTDQIHCFIHSSLKLQQCEKFQQSNEQKDFFQYSECEIKNLIIKQTKEYSEFFQKETKDLYQYCSKQFQKDYQINGCILKTLHKALRTFHVVAERFYQDISAMKFVFQKLRFQIRYHQQTYENYQQLEENIVLKGDEVNKFLKYQDQQYNQYQKCLHNEQILNSNQLTECISNQKQNLEDMTKRQNMKNKLCKYENQCEIIFDEFQEHIILLQKETEQLEFILKISLMQKYFNMDDIKNNIDFIQQIQYNKMSEYLQNQKPSKKNKFDWKEFQKKMKK